MTRRAFTILETILVIAIAALLLSTLLPTIGKSRREARNLKSLANLRSHAQIFAAYAVNYDDMFPYFMDPNVTATVLRLGNGEVLTVNRYFAASLIWNYALADEYYDGNPRHDSFYPSGFPSGVTYRTSRSGATEYFYGCVFTAHPDYWNPRTRMLGRAQLRPTRQADVKHPAKKVLLATNYPLIIDMSSPISKRPGFNLEVVCVDGSATQPHVTTIYDGYESGDGPAELAVHLVDTPPWTLHTIDGVRGRDLP